MQIILTVLLVTLGLGLSFLLGVYTGAQATATGEPSVAAEESGAAPGRPIPTTTGQLRAALPTAPTTLGGALAAADRLGSSAPRGGGPAAGTAPGGSAATAGEAGAGASSGGAAQPSGDTTPAQTGGARGGSAPADSKGPADAGAGGAMAADADAEGAGPPRPEGLLVPPGLRGDAIGADRSIEELARALGQEGAALKDVLTPLDPATIAQLLIPMTVAAAPMPQPAAVTVPGPVAPAFALQAPRALPMVQARQLAQQLAVDPWKPVLVPVVGAPESAFVRIEGFASRADAAEAGRRLAQMTGERLAVLRTASGAPPAPPPPPVLPGAVAPSGAPPAAPPGAPAAVPSAAAGGG